MNKGLAIFLIVIGVIVALSGIVVMTITSHWFLGLVMILAGLAFCYFIYTKYVSTDQSDKTNVKVQK